MTQALETQLQLLDRALARGAHHGDTPGPDASTRTSRSSLPTDDRETARDPEVEDLAALLAELASRDASPAPSALRERLLASVRETAGLSGFAARMAELLDWPQEQAESLLRTSSAALPALAGSESGSALESGEAAVPDRAPTATDPPGDWLPGPAPGICIRPVQPGPRHGVALAGLVWCAPGSVFPEHSHVGPEWALVLSGEAYDSTGAHWSVGDLVHQPAGSHHRFAIPAGGPPLLAAVVVREGFTLT